MMSPEPEHVCPVKCDGNGNKCPGLDTGRRCRSVEVTRTLSVQIADPPPVTYDQHSHHRHTTPVQEVNQSSSTPFPGHCTGVPSVPRVVSPPPEPRLCLLNWEQRDGRQNTELWLPTPCPPPVSCIQQGGIFYKVSLFLLFFIVFETTTYDGYIIFFLSVHYFII